MNLNIIKNLDFLINDSKRILEEDKDNINYKVMLVYFQQIKYYYLLSCFLDIDKRDMRKVLPELEYDNIDYDTIELFKIYDNLKHPVRNNVFYLKDYVDIKYPNIDYMSHGPSNWKEQKYIIK